MSTCAVCGHQMPHDAAFCDTCGTPADATHVAGGPSPSSPSAPGDPGDAPTSVSGGLPPSSSYGAPPGQQGGYGQADAYGQSGGYDAGYPQSGGGYGGSGYGGSGYGGSGYGGGYGGGYGELGQPASGKGGRGKWLAVWGVVGVLVVGVLVVALVLVFTGNDDEDDDRDTAGGGGSSSTDGTDGTEGTDGPDGSGITLGEVNDVPVDDDKAVVRVDADETQVVLLSSSDDLGIPFPDDAALEATSAEGWYGEEGFAAFVPERSGEQEVEFNVFGASDTVEIYVDVVDVETLSLGDDVPLVAGSPLGAAIYEDLSGAYVLPEGMYISSCTSEAICNLQGTVLAVADRSRLTPASAPNGGGLWTEGGTTLETTMPAGGGNAAFVATGSGSLTVFLENIADPPVDFRLQVFDKHGNEMCNRDSSFGDESCLISVRQGDQYSVVVTEYDEDPQATGAIRLQLIPGTND